MHASTQLFIKNTRVTNKKIRKNNWYDTIFAVGYILVFVMPSAVYSSIVPSGEDGYGFGASLGFGLSVGLGIGLCTVYYYGIMAIRSEWMKFDKVIQLLNKRYDLQKKLIDDIERAHSSASADSDAEHAYSVMSFLNEDDNLWG
ncbi:MAG: hypothetical protein WCV84_00335 [Patescibacteria group bacterium]